MLTKLHFAFFIMLQLAPGTQNPDDNSPVDFKDPFDLVVFVILPVVFIVLYMIWRKRRKTKKD